MAAARIFGDQCDGLSPAKRSFFRIIKERSFFPYDHTFEALLRLASLSRFPRVEIKTICASVDLRHAQLDDGPKLSSNRSGISFRFGHAGDSGAVDGDIVQTFYLRPLFTFAQNGSWGPMRSIERRVRPSDQTLYFDFLARW